MSHITIGRYQLIWWGVTEHRVFERECRLVVNPPRFEFSRNLCGGIIRWALCAGYVEVRRFTSLAVEEPDG